MALREVLAFFGFEVETKELEKGDALVEQFKGSIVGVGKAIAGAFALDALIGFGKELIDQADELREAAIAAGAIPQELQKIEFAAGTAGVEVGELRAALTRLNRVAMGKGQADTFEKLLGKDFRKNADGTQRTSTELFEAIGSAIAGIADPYERAQTANEIFGRSYAKLIPLFEEGSEGIAKLKAEAEDLGFVFDDAFLNNSDEINDNLAKVKKGLTGIAVEALRPLLPYLVELTQNGVAVVKSFVAWVKETKVLQSVMIALGSRGVVGLARVTGSLIARFGGLRGVLARVLPLLLRFVAPILAIDEALGFLQGRPSALGRELDRAFGAGTSEKIRTFIRTAIEGFRQLTQDGDAAYRTLARKNASWVDRITAGFALLVGGSSDTWTAIKEGIESTLVELQLSLAQFVVWAQEKWNALLAGLRLPPGIRTALGFDTGDAENRVAGIKRELDALQQRAYERETGTGQFEPAAARAAREANTGVTFYRNGAGDLSPEQQALSEMFRRTRIGGGPGGGPFFDPAVDLPTLPAPPARAVAPVPASVTNSTTVNAPQNNNVNQVFNINGDVKPSTVNRVGKTAKGATVEGLSDLRATQAALVSQSG